MGGRGAYYVPGRSRSVTSGAHKPWGIMGWPIVKAVALERFWEGGASCQNRSETVGPPRAYRAYRLRGPTAYGLRSLPPTGPTVLQPTSPNNGAKNPT